MYIVFAAGAGDLQPGADGPDFGNVQQLLAVAVLAGDIGRFPVLEQGRASSGSVIGFPFFEMPAAPFPSLVRRPHPRR
jgi:hypothetical protein